MRVGERMRQMGVLIATLEYKMNSKSNILEENPTSNDMAIRKYMQLSASVVPSYSLHLRLLLLTNEI